MPQFLILIVKNLSRNKTRTVLTALAVTVMVTISAQMMTVLSAIGRQVAAERSQSKLIVSERWVMPSQVPVRYLPLLTSIAGVEDWTTWNIYAGHFDESRQSGFEGLGIATRPENLCEMHTGLEKLDRAIVEALRREKTGAIMSANQMELMHWRVGDQFTFLSSSHPDKPLRFKIVGVMPPGEWPRNFFFCDDYFRDGVGNKETVNCVWLRLSNADVARQVAAQIQEEFERRQPELKVETESAGIARFASRGQAILSIIELVVAILVIDMIIVLSNSISVATRERRGEMAVLKVLGFEPRSIMALVIGEATLVGVISGLVGAGAAWGVSSLAVNGLIPSSAFTRVFLIFPIHADSMLWGVLLGAAVGFTGSVIPAWSARKVKVSDVFAKIA